MSRLPPGRPIPVCPSAAAAPGPPTRISLRTFPCGPGVTGIPASPTNHVESTSNFLRGQTVMLNRRFALLVLLTLTGCEWLDSLTTAKFDNPVVGPPPPRVAMANEAE